MLKQNKQLLVSVIACMFSVLSAEEVKTDSLIVEMSHSTASEEKKPNGAMGPVLATNNPLPGRSSVSFDVGLILQQIRVSDTDFVNLHGSNPGTPFVGTPEKPFRFDITQRYQFNLSPGLRVALAYNSDFDNWKASAEFEWLPSVASVNEPTQTRQDGHYINTNYPEMYYPGNTRAPIFGNASARLQVNYYLLDLVLSRGAYLSKKFSFEPQFGLKATWIYYDTTQKTWNDTEGNDQDIPDGTSWLIRVFNDVWGVGPMMALDGNYFISSGFSIFTYGNFAVLFGEAKTTYYNGFVVAEEIPGNIKVEDLDRMMTLTLRGIVGLQYDTEVTAGEQHMRIRAGFDTRFYLQQFPRVNFYAYEKISDADAGGDTFEVVPTPVMEESGDFGMVGLLLDIAFTF